MTTQESNEQKAVSKFFNTLSSFIIFIWIFGIIWGIVGFAGFVTSIICFWKSGTTGQHIIGLILALLLGPFYWLYYGFVKSYCKSM